jgi:hypothetical protein
MTRNILILIVIFITSSSYAQGEWDKWNSEYEPINISKLIEYENKYADSVERGLISGETYSRYIASRITAKYKGGSVVTNDEIKNSIGRVMLIHLNDSASIDLIQNSYLFEIDGKLMWLPIQKQLELPFKKEINSNDEVILYGIFTNEHIDKGKLMNNFFICEFRKVVIGN